MSTTHSMPAASRTELMTSAKRASVKTTLAPESLSTWASSRPEKRRFSGLITPPPKSAACHSSRWRAELAAITPNRSPGRDPEPLAHPRDQPLDPVDVRLVAYAELRPP